MNTHRPTSRLLALLIAALLAGPGCTRYYIVSVDELRKLDGFGVPSSQWSPGTRVARPKRALTAADGSIIPFSASSTLWLLGPKPEVKGQFRSIRLTPTEFEGVLVETEQAVRADLTSVYFAKVEAMDPGATLLVTGSVVMGGLTLIFGLIAFSRPSI